MTPKELLADCVEPALSRLFVLAGIPVTDQARVLVMAIAGQESDWQDRRQHGGPARSFWQFEQGGGVVQLIGTTPRQLQAVCNYLFVPFNGADIYEAMAWNDTLAACMARLLIWQDPAALPAVGDVQTAWDYYDRNWRPGAPSRDRWTLNYTTAKGLLT